MTWPATARTVELLRRVGETSGFFVVVGHQVPAEVVLKDPLFGSAAG
jgi:hypothetical protein